MDLASDISFVPIVSTHTLQLFKHYPKFPITNNRQKSEVQLHIMCSRNWDNRLKSLR